MHVWPRQSKTDVTVSTQVPDVADASWVMADGKTYRESVAILNHLPKEFSSQSTIIFTLLPSGVIKVTFDVGEGYETREVEGVH